MHMTHTPFALYPFRAGKPRGHTGSAESRAMPALSVIRALHIITDLRADGAEMMLCKLVAAMDRSRFENAVVSLMDQGALREQVVASGVRLYSPGIRGRIPSPGSLLKLLRFVRSYQPDVVQTWLYHADLVGLIAARLAGVPALCWSLHACSPQMRGYPFVTKAIVRILAAASGLPSAVITVSAASRSCHEMLGYAPRRWIYIPIGVDLEVFRPRPEAKKTLRERLGLGPESRLIGMVARYHPEKDHCNFLRALALVSRDCPEVRAVMMGREVETDNEGLRRMISTLGIEDRVHLIGERRDIAELMAGLDLLCIASNSESNPNVLSEAMACEVPCVVTDVGDCASVVGVTGRVVPPNDHEALAEALKELLTTDPEALRRLGADARRRVSACFSLGSVVREYEKLYTELSAKHYLQSGDLVTGKPGI